MIKQNKVTFLVYSGELILVCSHFLTYNFFCTRQDKLLGKETSMHVNFLRIARSAKKQTAKLDLLYMLLLQQHK